MAENGEEGLRTWEEMKEKITVGFFFFFFFGNFFLISFFFNEGRK